MEKEFRVVAECQPYPVTRSKSRLTIARRMLGHPLGRLAEGQRDGGGTAECFCWSENEIMLAPRLDRSLKAVVDGGTEAGWQFGMQECAFLFRANAQSNMMA
jgi:hypothetical protein